MLREEPADTENGHSHQCKEDDEESAGQRGQALVRRNTGFGEFRVPVADLCQSLDPASMLGAQDWSRIGRRAAGPIDFQ